MGKLIKRSDFFEFSHFKRGLLQAVRNIRQISSLHLIRRIMHTSRTYRYTHSTVVMLYIINASWNVRTKSCGNYVKIENTTTDKCLQYPFGTSTDLFKGKTKFFAELIHALENSGLKGAEILYNNTIPNFISSKHAFSAALIKSLMQVSDIELTPLETAAICALNDDLTPYLAVLFSKKGYCTLMNSGEPKNLPLPLSGYKILTAHCTEPLSNHSKHIKYAMSEIRRFTLTSIQYQTWCPKYWAPQNHRLKTAKRLNICITYPPKIHALIPFPPH